MLPVATVPFRSETESTVWSILSCRAAGSATALGSGTGAKGRYHSFYLQLETDLQKLPYEEVSDVKETLISNTKQKLNSSLNPNGDIQMIDRDENAKSAFKMVVVNIDKGTGFESGHRKAGIEGKNIDNYFLQFEGDKGF